MTNPIQLDILYKTYKIDRAKAAMTDLTEVCEELLGVLLEEEICDLGVLQAPCPAGGGHAASRGTRRARRGLSGRATATRQAPLVTHLPEGGSVRMETCR